MQCGWTITGETERTVMDAHWAALAHSYALDEGEGHGPVLLIADVWDWSPEPWTDSRLEPGGYAVVGADIIQNTETMISNAVIKHIMDG